MYTVRFLNYAGDDLLGVVFCEEGEDITDRAPEPEVFEDKVFVSWNVDITNIQEDMTVRPIYNFKMYTVIFYKADKRTALSTQSIPYGKDAEAPDPEEVVDKDFVSWDKEYTNVKTDLNIYPIYKPKTFAVRFYDKDGGYISTAITEYGKTAIAPAPRFYSRYIFLNWDKDYSNITANLDVYSIYRDVPINPLLSFYKKNEDETSGELIKSYRGVNACSIVQKLDG